MSGWRSVLDLRHGEHVETLVQLLLAEFVTDQTAVDDGLPDRLLLLQGLLGNGGRLLVSDRRVQGRDDGRRRLGEGPEVIGIGYQARDTPVGEQPRDVGEKGERFENVPG